MLNFGETNRVSREESGVECGMEQVMASPTCREKMTQDPWQKNLCQGSRGLQHRDICLPRHDVS
jgi:hypothetical protein